MKLCTKLIIKHFGKYESVPIHFWRGGEVRSVVHWVIWKLGRLTTNDHRFDKKAQQLLTVPTKRLKKKGAFQWKNYSGKIPI